MLLISDAAKKVSNWVLYIKVVILESLKVKYSYTVKLVY